MRAEKRAERKTYTTAPFKVAYALFGEAVIFATSEATARRKVQEMGSRYLVERSRNTEHQIIDMEPEKVKATA